ncbi:MAG: hypothetical protein ACLRFP_00975 [Alphaproteobacteria bacterium]
MAKLNWFLRLKNLASSDPVAKDLWDAIKNADSPEKEQDAKDAAKAYVESLPDPVEDEPTPQPEPETPVVSDDGEMEIETESGEPVGDRPEITPALSPLAAKIARRQKLTEEAIAKRRNQPITLTEQKKAAIEKGKEVMKRNAEKLAQRKALHEMIMKQMAERKAQDTKNMVGVLTILKRELALNIRLAVIMEKHNISLKDIQTLKANNKSGWQECLNIRGKLDKELDLLS